MTFSFRNSLWLDIDGVIETMNGISAQVDNYNDFSCLNVDLSIYLGTDVRNIMSCIKDHTAPSLLIEGASIFARQYLGTKTWIVETLL